MLVTEVVLPSLKKDEINEMNRDHISTSLLAHNLGSEKNTTYALLVTRQMTFTGYWYKGHDTKLIGGISEHRKRGAEEAGRVQIRRKGLNARFLIRNKAQSPRILDQVAQFISH